MGCGASSAYEGSEHDLMNVKTTTDNKPPAAAPLNAEGFSVYPEATTHLPLKSPTLNPTTARGNYDSNSD